MPVMSFGQADVSYSGEQTDGDAGRPSCRYASWVQAGAGLPIQRMCIEMVHTDDTTGGEGRQAVITLIDYCAAFDTESQLFLDEALAEAGVDAKVRRIVQAIFAAATGVVRIRQADGSVALSEPFNIARGVLQGDIFSPIASIAGLDRIFRRHDVHTASSQLDQARAP